MEKVNKDKKHSVDQRTINVGVRLSKVEHERLINAKKKINYTTADILLLGVEYLENLKIED